MDKKIEALLNKIDDITIVKLGIMLADADKKLFEAEKQKLTIDQTSSIDPELLSKLTPSMSKDEIGAYIEKVNAGKKETQKNIDINIMNAKMAFRQIAIAFDIVKLVVENRKIK